MRCRNKVVPVRADCVQGQPFAPTIALLLHGSLRPPVLCTAGQ